MTTKEDVAFDPLQPEALVAIMDELHTAGGWCNVLPGVDEEEARRATPSGVFSSLFGAAPPLVAMGTYLPLAGRRHGEVRVGILHAAGRLQIDGQRRLAGGVPQGWRVTQDHARRGLVLAVPAATPTSEIATWLVRAISDLTAVRTQTPWLAEVHRRG
jgi:hypothetical protein